MILSEALQRTRSDVSVKRRQKFSPELIIHITYVQLVNWNEVELSNGH